MQPVFKAPETMRLKRKYNHVLASFAPMFMLRRYSKGSNYLDFLREAPAGSWGVEVQAGHFQFLDNPNFIERAVCSKGSMDDEQAWGVLRTSTRPMLNRRTKSVRMYERSL
jgi:hypothetical protein